MVVLPTNVTGLSPADHRSHHEALHAAFNAGGAIIADNSIATVKYADLSVTAAKIANGTITDAKVATANKDGAAGVYSMRTLGTGATQAASGTDSRLSDARTPTAHAASHKNGGADEVAVAAAAANAIPKAGAGAKLDKGWLPVFIASGAGHAVGAVPDPGVTVGAAKFLREDATWQVPGGSTGAGLAIALG